MGVVGKWACAVPPRGLNLHDELKGSSQHEEYF